jgi:hypothetical protein
MLEIRRDTYLTEPAGELISNKLENVALAISLAVASR